MLRRFVPVVAAATTLVAALAGCTSSDGSEGSGASGEVKTLKIATIAFKQFFGDFEAGVKARLDDANAAKEVDGYAFDYLGVIDDKFTPDGAVAAFREAKEKDGVFAVIGNASPQLPTEYINKQKLPLVSLGQSDAFCTHGSTEDWYSYSIVGCSGATNRIYGFNLSQPVAELLGGGDGKTVACIGEDYPNAVTNAQAQCDAFEAAGFEIALVDASIPAPPAVVSDFSPFVQKLMTADNGKPVDVVELNTGPSGSAGLAQGLERAGYKGAIAGGAGYSPATAEAEKGVTEWTNFATPMAASTTPEMKKIVDSLVRSGVPEETISAKHIQAWLFADMFLKIAEATEGELTAEAWAETAKTFTYEVDGVVGPTTYPQAFAANTPCSELATSDGTEWKIVRPYTCDDVYRAKDKTFVEYDDVDPAEKY